MINFQIFGIPVRVQPFFWLMAFFIGGGIHAGRDRESLARVLVAMAVIFVSILVHELGHALTSRKFTGANPRIEFHGMGGLAFPNVHLTRHQSFWVTWAGPLAGFGLFLLTALLVMGLHGPSNGFHFVTAYLLPGVDQDFRYLVVQSRMTPLMWEAVTTLLLVNFWWSVINLLPVYPLDGGQIYAAIEDSHAKVIKVGMITGILAAVAFVLTGRLIGAVLFGYLAYENYKRLEQLQGGFR